VRWGRLVGHDHRVVTRHSDVRLGERVVIVTGGSRGTGRDLAHAFARSGHAVVIGYAHSQGAADTAVDEILSDGGAAIAIRADVADELDVERLFLETREQFGGVDLVVEAPGRMSALVRAAARRHLRPGGMVVSFAGRGCTSAPIDVGEIVAWFPVRSGAREVVVLPVSDVDRAKRFYLDLGWRLDDDLPTGDSFRFVKLTPAGSRASVIFGVGLTPAVPGSVDALVLPVHPEGRRNASLVSVSDPDGNTWLLQEIGTRLPGR
jgi:hypothetical protein